MSTDTTDRQPATSPRALVVYASKHGHTARIAARIASRLDREGIATDVRDVAAVEERRPAEYDVVIVGASIHAGHHDPGVVAWAEHHRTALAEAGAAFFSVCLTAADDTDEARTATRGYLDEFAERTGWSPEVAVTFAGALQYREYDFMTRLLMRLLMKRGGHPTDTSHDYDYTDWDAVDAFASGCARRVGARDGDTSRSVVPPERPRVATGAARKR